MDELTRVAETSERLKEALRISGKKQVDVARETGIDKGSISNYISGRYEPKLPAVKKLAQSLGVSEMWLWGYDVPRERIEVVPREISEQNNLAVQFVSKMNNDDAFLNAVWRLTKLDDEQLAAFNDLDDKQFAAFVQFLSTFKKD